MQKAIYLIPIIAMLLGSLVYTQIVNEASDVTTVNGDVFSWKDKQGDWVYINFFAEWCAPCLKEIPEINEFYINRQANTEVFLVSFDRLEKNKLSQIIDKYDIQPPVIVNDSEMKLPIPMPSGLPATYLISPKGKVVDQHLGEITASQMFKMLEDND